MVSSQETSQGTDLVGSWRKNQSCNCSNQQPIYCMIYCVLQMCGISSTPYILHFSKSNLKITHYFSSPTKYPIYLHNKCLVLFRQKRLNSLSHDSLSYALIKSELCTHFSEYASFPDLSTLPWTPQCLHIPRDTPSLCAVYLRHIWESAVSHKCTILSPISLWVMISPAHSGLRKQRCQRHIAVTCTQVYSVCLRPHVQSKRIRGLPYNAMSAYSMATSQLCSCRAQFGTHKRTAL